MLRRRDDAQGSTTRSAPPGSDLLRMNRDACAQLGGRKQLSIVPGATHLFEEPGTLDVAARLAVDWFAEHLGIET